MLNWESELDAWEDKYQPIKNPFAHKHKGNYVANKFETYGEELNYVLGIATTEPARVWTLVDGDDGNLYIVDGYHLVNRVNYFITMHPREGGFMEVPYFIFDHEEEGEEEVPDEPRDC